MTSDHILLTQSFNSINLPFSEFFCFLRSFFMQPILRISLFLFENEGEGLYFSRNVSKYTIQFHLKFLKTILKCLI